MNKLDDKLYEIYNDKQSGSLTVLQKLIELLIDECENNNQSNIIANINQIELSLGHFAAVKHFMGELKFYLTNSKKMDKGKEPIIIFIRNYDSRWKNVNQKIASIALQNIQLHGKKILLHSNSSTICSLFGLVAKSNIDVLIIQTESRPENEGSIQAEALAAMDLDVSMIVDSAAGLLIPQIDVVLFGADQVYSNFYINKIGTHAITLLARACNVPCYVLADSRKIDLKAGDQNKLLELSKPGNEIWFHENKKITPINYYFEPIPCSLIEAFVTENGIFKNSENNDL